MFYYFFFFFFFQAEDGIRDTSVTGVQTCALPISVAQRGPLPKGATRVERMKRKLQTKAGAAIYAARKAIVEPVFGQIKQRSEERRVGKECRTRLSPYH